MYYFMKLFILVVTVFFFKFNFVISFDPKHPNLKTTVPYKDCGSEYASLTNLTVHPPCNDKICVVKRGEDVTLIAHFIPRRSSSTLRVQVDQVDPNLGFSTHIFPEFSPCGRRNISCPIKENEIVYSFVLDQVSKSMIPFKMNVKVVAMADDRKPFLCIITPLDLK